MVGDITRERSPQDHAAGEGGGVDAGVENFRVGHRRQNGGESARCVDLITTSGSEQFPKPLIIQAVL